MTRFKDRSLGMRVDSAILNSGVARYLRLYSANRRRETARPAFKPNIWPPTVIIIVSVIAVIVAVSDPRIIPAAMVGLAIVNIAMPITRFGSAFAPPLDERELAVHRASTSAGYIATTLVTAAGLFTLMAQALSESRLLYQVGEEAAMFILLGVIALATIPRIYKAMQYPGRMNEE